MYSQAKESRGLAENTRSYRRQKNDFPLDLSGRAWPCPYLDFRVGAYRTVRQKISSVLGQSVFVILILQHYETNILTLENLRSHKPKTWCRKIKYLATQDCTTTSGRNTSLFCLFVCLFYATNLGPLLPCLENDKNENSQF